MADSSMAPDSAGTLEVLPRSPGTQDVPQEAATAAPFPNELKVIPKGALEDITGVHETLIKELILVEALPRSPGAQDAPRRPQLRPKSQTGSTGPPREAQKTQHEPCGPVAAGGRGAHSPLDSFTRARNTHTNTHARTHARTHGFLRRHTSPSVIN